MALRDKVSRRKFGKWILRNGVLVPFAAPPIIRAASIHQTPARGVVVSAGSDDPTDVTGLALWVRASNDSGTNVSCYTDAGTTLATNGQTIYQWNDESGNGNHLVQTASGERGTWNNNVVNSKAAITMVAASSQHWDVPNVFSGFTAGEGFCVLIYDADPPASQQAIVGATGSSGFNSFMDTDGIIYDDWGSTTRKDTVNPTPSLTSWRLYNVSSGSGNWTSRIDGTQIYTTGTNTVGFGTAPKLGRAGTVYVNGKFAEYIVYNKVLNSTERDTVENYIATKYNLTIA